MVGSNSPSLDHKSYIEKKNRVKLKDDNKLLKMYITFQTMKILLLYILGICWRR